MQTKPTQTEPMFDAPVRRVLDRPLAVLAGLIDHPFVSPNRMTLLGLATGLASAATAATQLWWWALGLWLFSRVMDGLDGPLARRRRATEPSDVETAPESESSSSSEAGGFLDIMADFTVYGATVVGVAIGATGQYGVGWLPFLAVLLATTSTVRRSWRSPPSPLGRGANATMVARSAFSEVWPRAPKPSPFTRCGSSFPPRLA